MSTATKVEDYKAKYEALLKEKEELQKNLDEVVKFHNDTMQLFQDAGTDIGAVAKGRKIFSAPKPVPAK